MADKCDKCETCLDCNTDYWQRPCFICVFGNMWMPYSRTVIAMKDRWK